MPHAAHEKHANVVPGVVQVDPRHKEILSKNFQDQVGVDPTGDHRPTNIRSPTCMPFIAPSLLGKCIERRERVLEIEENKTPVSFFAAEQ